MLWETHKVKLGNISPIFGFLFCLDNVQNKHKKIKDKYLNPRYLPSIILIFSTFVLFFDSGLGGGQRKLIIMELYLFRETFGKHFVFILHVLHPCPNIHNFTDYISYVTLLFILYCYCIHAGA